MPEIIDKLEELKKYVEENNFSLFEIESALITSIEYDEEDIVSYLLSLIEKKEDFKFLTNPFHASIDFKRINTLNLIIKKFKYIDDERLEELCSNGMLVAIAKGDIQIFKTLLPYIKVKDNNNSDVLYISTLYNREEMIDILYNISDVDKVKEEIDILIKKGMPASNYVYFLNKYNAQKSKEDLNSRIDMSKITDTSRPFKL